VKKNRLKFWKNRPVRFQFYKLKTEPNRIQIEKNRAKPVWTGFVLKNRTETGRFEPVSFFLNKIFGLVIFFYKNRTDPKWSPLVIALKRFLFFFGKINKMKRIFIYIIIFIKNCNFRWWYTTASYTHKLSAIINQFFFFFFYQRSSFNKYMPRPCKETSEPSYTDKIF
jgi:hypothetical protein